MYVHKIFLLTMAVAGSLLVSACEQAPQNPSDGQGGPVPGPTSLPNAEVSPPALETQRKTPPAMLPAAPDQPLPSLTATPRAIVSTDPLLNPVGLVDRPLGSPEAKVVLIEYLSPSCAQCARFFRQTYSALIADYVQTGKIQFVVRPFVRNALDGAVFMLAECSGQGYHDMLNTFLARQNQWAISERPKDAILAIALQKGFTEASFTVCLADTNLRASIEAMRVQASGQFGLKTVPTFYLNGKKLSGNLPMAVLAAQIDALL